MTYVPIPARESAGQIRVAAGDTIVSLCSRLGQPLANYPHLIAANLDRPMTDAGVPEGQAVVFAGLHEGDLLNVPADWGNAPVSRWPFTGRLAGLEGAPGMLGDAVTDSFVAAFPYDPASSIDQDQYDANVHVLTSWWRDKYQNGALPQSAASWTPYQGAAVAWWDNVASKLYAALPWPQNKKGVSDAIRQIPFGMAPLPQLVELYKAGIPLLKGLDKGKLNFDLESHIKPGQFPKTKKPVDWPLLSDKSFKFYESIGFGPQQWLDLAGVRWDLLPIDQILARVKSGQSQYKAGEDVNDWLMSELKAILFPGQQEDIQIEIPGNIPGIPPIDGGAPVPGVPGPCPPQGVPKDGTCDCTEKMGGTAIYDEKLFLCVDCGPNTKPYVKGSKQCECMDGFEPHPSGAEGSGCVKKAGPGGGGGLLPPSAGEKESPWKPAAIALGVLAVGFGLAKAAKVI